MVSYVVKIKNMELMDNLAFYGYNKYDFSKWIHYEKLTHNESLIDIESEKLMINEKLAVIISGGLMDSPWPMKCHDLYHTSTSPYSTASNPGIEKWRFECDWVDTTPVIDSEGIIYFGGGYGGLPWYLYAIYPNGTLKWRYKTEGAIMGSSPAIAEDATIYVGSWDAKLYAVNANGTLKWKSSAGGSIACSPAIAQDGTIYVGTMSSGNSLIAFHPNGTRKWKYETNYSITGGPAIGDDGTIYIGSGDTYFYAINPIGTLKWRFKTGHYIKGSPSIAEDGTIYIGSYDDYLYALYPNGTIKWKCKVGSGTETNPSIANDGTIYVGGDKLYAVYPNGTMRWNFDLGTNRHIHQSSPAISADGTIYIGTNIGETSGGDIIAVSPNGTEKWRKKIANDWVDSSPSIAEDGTVYIGGVFDLDWETSYIHAFGAVGSNLPPDAPRITGPTSGRAGTKYNYTFIGNDQDNNPISLYIEWGDGNNENTREYASGEPVKIEHSWSDQGNYTIRVKAKDVLGEESNWSILEVTMPKNRQKINRLYLSFLDNHPRAFPILRILLNYNSFFNYLK